MLSHRLMQAAAANVSGANNKATPVMIEDVFSTYLYTGNGSTQSIVNGIDLASKGGLTWVKSRNNGTNDHHSLQDTVNGTSKYLISNSSGTAVTDSTMVTAFNSNGFSLGAGLDVNRNTINFASWTFAKAAKFFDVVQYAGAATGQTINHSLGSVPGMIIIKDIGAADDWMVYHRSVGATKYLSLNQTIAATTLSSFMADTEPTSTQFTVGTTGGVNASGHTYIAYLFAHDTASTGLIQCGSYTTDGSGNASVTLGWEPQFVMTKVISTTGNWTNLDVMRGMDQSANAQLRPNLANAEAAAGADIRPTATGFQNVTAGISVTVAYLAIRRGPMKLPTVGTQVYNALTRVGNASTYEVSGIGFPLDLIITNARDDAGRNHRVFDRLRGPTISSFSNLTNAEETSAIPISEFTRDGFKGDYEGDMNISGKNYINWFFRRYPGVFDVVCYTGTGSTPLNVTHNLGVVPELIIIKCRSAAGGAWAVYNTTIGNAAGLRLNSTGDQTEPARWNNTTPTATVFTVAAFLDVNNNSSTTYVAYLFATLAGISKVGSYTGNGTSQTINCGFTTGARFIMIKVTSTTGDWFVYDTTRTYPAGNDYHLSLNTTDAEVVTTDDLDADNSGFIVNQNATTNLNVNTATYIFLAFA